MTQHDRLQTYREHFFNRVVETFSFEKSCRVLVVTHLLPDRPTFLTALSRIADISTIVPIPYSIDTNTERFLGKTHKIHRLSLQEMSDGKRLLHLTSAELAAKDTPLAVLEIGGYFARIGNSLRRMHGPRFLGSVEDTESGHRRYEEQQLEFPVISAARSPLKEIEDRLIGPSVIFSVERFVRKMDCVLSGIEIGVLGYGKIGMSVARAAAARGCRVLVYDSNSQKRLLAFADGFRIPEREILLKNADVIIGATGFESIGKEDFYSLRDGVLLGSASSKQVEFDLATLARVPNRESDIVPGVREYQLAPGKNIYLLSEGEPVNFKDRAVVGPALSLVQAELLLGVRMLSRVQNQAGLSQVSQAEQQALCDLWITHFMTAAGGPVARYDIMKP